MAVVKRTLENLEIIGGALCLDFTNTINSRLTPEHDYLQTYADLTAWAQKIGLLNAAQASALEKQASQEKGQAEMVVQVVRTQRETIYRIFSQLARQDALRLEDMRALLKAWGEALPRGQLIKQGEIYQFDWPMDQALDAPLWPIIHSAGELLLSEEQRKVKSCPGCGWLFVDTSRNQSRRWCSMNSCGVSDKMRRYYRKSQQS